MLRTVGVGIIGLGFVGSGAHLPALAKIKNAKIVALSDVVESVLEKQAAKYGVPAIYRDYNELLKNSEVEAVIIATPTPFHTTIALAALKAGKHVICEMPLAPTLEEVDMTIDAAKSTGVILMPSLNFRFTPIYVKAKDLIDRGVLNNPTAIMYREFIPAMDLAKQWPAGSWVWDINKAGGPLFTLSVWSIDLMRWLLGIEIMNLTASVKYFSIPKLGTLGYNAFVNYQFEKDVIGCLQTSGAVTHAASTSILEVIGSNTYSVKATWNNELALFLDDPDKTEWRLKGTEAYKVWGHMQMDEYFLECVARGIKPSITPEDGRKAVEVACKIVGKE